MSYMKQNKKHKQTIESAQYGLEISFKAIVKCLGASSAQPCTAVGSVISTGGYCCASVYFLLLYLVSSNTVHVSIINCV